MYYHIFTGENIYSQSLLNLLDKSIDMDKHMIFFGFAKKTEKKYEYSERLSQRIKHLTNPSDLLYFINNIKNTDWIYIHYLAYDPSLLFWANNISLLHKSTWVAWGNDIYSYYKRDKNIKTKIYEKLRVKIIKEIPEIAVFVKEDFELIKSFYQTDAYYTPIMYPMPVNIEHLKDLNDSKKDSTIRFLIGNSGDPSNLHFEMLDYLRQYKNENIQIQCPMAYGGNNEYKNSVINYGKEIFGDKFTAITEMMNLKDYGEFLSTINISLMNHNRQQGLGNILALLYLGKKVYMRTEITSYFYFQRQDCEIYNISELSNTSFDMIKAPLLNKSKNKQIVTEIISEKNYLKLWLDLLKKHEVSI